MLRLARTECGRSRRITTTPVAVVLCIGAMLGLTARRISGAEPVTTTDQSLNLLAPSTDAGWPDIAAPGPDMGDFPNSAATLPHGRSYLEMAPLTLVAQGDHNPAAYAWPFLFRYGVTDNVEFRLFANGLTSALSGESVTGFSPLAFDLKVHLWDDQRERLIPASSLEVYIQTEFGSPDFRQGTQKSIALNFDLPLTERTNLEWTFGYSGVFAAITGVHGNDLHANEFSFQWAIEHNLTDDFELFVTGYYNGAVFLQQGAGSVVGVGASWNVSDRLNLFGSCNAGLDDNVAPVAGQIGFAVAL